MNTMLNHIRTYLCCVNVLQLEECLEFGGEPIRKLVSTWAGVACLTGFACNAVKQVPGPLTFRPLSAMFV